METIGRIFKVAREKQKHTLREVADQTKIGSRYLGALEEDRYNAFPSQTHITGFIRSYAKFLDLDPERMIDIYKRTLVQESPAPIEELTAPNKPKSAFPPFISVIVVLAVLLFVFIFISSMPKNQPRVVVTTEPESIHPSDTVPHADSRYFALGSFIPITIDGEEKRIIFEHFAPDTVTVAYGNERYSLAVGRTHTLDFSGDGNADIRISISAVSNHRAYGNATILHRQQIQEEPSQQQQGAASRTILRSETQTEIRLTISASGIATISTVRDQQEQSHYFLKKGDTITVTARNTMQLTANNPHNLLLNLNNINLEMDTRNPAAGFGFVFKWRQNPADGLYHLEYEQLR
jgi:cytoskeletal protein RodZ